MPVTSCSLLPSRLVQSPRNDFGKSAARAEPADKNNNATISARICITALSFFEQYGPCLALLAAAQRSTCGIDKLIDHWIGRRRIRNGAVAGIASLRRA